MSKIRIKKTILKQIKRNLFLREDNQYRKNTKIQKSPYEKGVNKEWSVPGLPEKGENTMEVSKVCRSWIIGSLKKHFVYFTNF